MMKALIDSIKFIVTFFSLQVTNKFIIDQGT